MLFSMVDMDRYFMGTLCLYHYQVWWCWRQHCSKILVQICQITWHDVSDDRSIWLTKLFPDM